MAQSATTQKTGKNTPKIAKSSDEQAAIKRSAKARRNGKRRALEMAPGTDLMSEVRNDRREAAQQRTEKRAEKHQFSTTEFLAAFYGKLCEQVQQGKIDASEGELVATYADSLVTGDGHAPDGLSDNARQRVELGFALGVVFYAGTGRPAGMAGQRADWSADVFKKARKIRADRDKRRKAQPQKTANAA